LTTVGLCLVEMTTGLQTHLVATVLPRAVRDIGGIQLYGLVFSGYMLAGIVSIPASGADADRHGPARPLFRCSSYFLVGPVIAALAPSMPLLVVARFIQGYGGGAMYSMAYGIVPRVYPAHLRPKMLSLLAGVWALMVSRQLVAATGRSNPQRAAPGADQLFSVTGSSRHSGSGHRRCPFVACVSRRHHRRAGDGSRVQPRAADGHGTRTITGSRC
jgi:hypothetical protein